MIFRTLVKFLPIACLTLAGACQSYPLTYKGEASSTVTQSSVVIGQNSKTDILFVVDNSGSMEDKQNDLRSNTDAFIAELAKSSGTSYHLGILTTDLYAATDAGRLRRADATAPPFFWSSPEATDPNPAATRAAIVQGFQDTVHSLGIAGSSNEAALGTALTALTSTDPAVMAQNAGFLRDDADLAIIVVSDEDDCTPGTGNLGKVGAWTADADCYQPLNQTFLYPVGDLVNQFAQVKKDPSTGKANISRVRAGLITGGLSDPNGTFAARGCNFAADGNATDNCGCWLHSSDDFFCTFINQPTANACTSLKDASTNVCGNNACAVNGACGPQQCPATPASRYVQFMNALSNQRVTANLSPGVRAGSICQMDYHTTLLQLANDVVLSSCFSLPSAALSPNDIQVKVAHAQADGSAGPSTLLPRYDPQGAASSGACNSCSGACAQGAWEYQGASSICLACGASLQIGDAYSFSVLSGLSGNPNRLP